MANPIKGEAKFGDYTLAINFGFFCTLEQELEMRADGIFDLMTTGISFTQLRTIIRTALQKHHPGTTDEQAEEIIDEAGGYKPAYVAIGAALKAYAGEPEAKDENPRKAA